MVIIRKQLFWVTFPYMRDVSPSTIFFKGESSFFSSSQGYQRHAQSFRLNYQSMALSNLLSFDFFPIETSNLFSKVYRLILNRICKRIAFIFFLNPRFPWPSMHLKLLGGFINWYFNKNLLSSRLCCFTKLIWCYVHQNIYRLNPTYQVESR